MAVIRSLDGRVVRPSRSTDVPDDLVGVAGLAGQGRAEQRQGRAESVPGSAKLLE